MNQPQRVVLILAALAVALMVAFPPWLFVYDFPGEQRLSYTRYSYKDPAYYATRFAGYHAITGANRPTDVTYLGGAFSIEVDSDDLRFLHAHR